MFVSMLTFLMSMHVCLRNHVCVWMCIRVYTYAYVCVRGRLND